MAYIIKSNTFKGHIEVRYNQHGLLQHIAIDTDITDVELLATKLSRIPLQEQDIPKLQAKGAQIVLVADNISFDAFWQAYNYKVGKKEKVIQLWKLLSDADKKAAMAGIPTYNRWLQTTTTAKLYPERYISYRKWENEY